VPPPSQLVPPLLAWFRVNARDLPWRRTRDPYAIWIAEIMLQQTQVKTVRPYWERWLREVPTVADLAAAAPDRVLKLWEGLGYYRRARHLHSAAQVIVSRHRGRVPHEFDELLTLPGIGRYTAGAIASIAFDQPRPILDGNVIRVLTRLFGIRENPRLRSVNDQLWHLADELVAAAHARPGADNCSHLNQGLMELGALVCTPRRPDCAACPWRRHCVARREGSVDRLPNLGARPATTVRHFFVFLMARGNRWLVHQRPADAVNAHLWEFPNREVDNAHAEPTEVAAELLGRKPASLQRLGRVRGTITRYRMLFDVFRVTLPASARVQRQSGQWKDRVDLEALAFSSAHRRILRLLDRETDG
jgi:A/G-specific adenine glycosylase